MVSLLLLFLSTMWANFAPLLRKQSHLPNVNQNVFLSISNPKVSASVIVTSLRLAEQLVRFEPETFLFIHNTIQSLF